MYLRDLIHVLDCDLFICLRRFINVRSDDLLSGILKVIKDDISSDFLDSKVNFVSSYSGKLIIYI